VDLLTVFFDAASVEPDGLEDTSDNVVAGVLVVLEEAGHEDSLDMLRGENLGVSAHCFTFSSILGENASRLSGCVFSCAHKMRLRNPGRLRSLILYCICLSNRGVMSATP
jgi:hypothetical protein